MPLAPQHVANTAVLHKAFAFKITILLVLGLVALSTLLVARAYTLEIVNHVVYRTYLQKSPAGIDPEQVRAAFTGALSEAQGNHKARDKHLQRLFEISQRLEKLQRLTEKDALDILEALRK